VNIILKNREKRGRQIDNLILQIVIKVKIFEIESHKFEYILNEFLKTSNFDWFGSSNVKTEIYCEYAINEPDTNIVKQKHTKIHMRFLERKGEESTTDGRNGFDTGS